MRSLCVSRIFANTVAWVLSTGTKLIEPTVIGKCLGSIGTTKPPQAANDWPASTWNGLNTHTNCTNHSILFIFWLSCSIKRSCSLVPCCFETTTRANLPNQPPVRCPNTSKAKGQRLTEILGFHDVAPGSLQWNEHAETLTLKVRRNEKGWRKRSLISWNNKKRVKLNTEHIIYENHTWRYIARILSEQTKNQHL